MIPFLADVGGFFGNPEAELLVRWYQVSVNILITFDLTTCIFL